MTCRHQPIFKFKSLFAQKPQYTCKHCGAAIELTPQFKTVSRIINIALIAAMALMIFNSNNITIAGLPPLVSYLGTVFLLLVIYLLLTVLLIKFGRYQEIETIEEPAALDENATPVEKPQYSAEQLEIMAMYAQIEKQARGESGDETLPDTSVVPEVAAVEDTCKHQPVASWKNYIPGKFEFVCMNCGKPIVFHANVKRNINLLFLVVMALIMMPNIMNTDISMWIFGLYTLLALAISIVIQFYFVKRGKFDLKLPGAK